MPHHRHFMERRLTIEDYNVAVDNVAFYSPAELQIDIPATFMITEIDSFACVANDIFRSGMLVGAVAYEFLEFMDVEGGDCFRVGEGLGNTPWYTNCIETQIWISRNNSPCRKIDPLPHQIASQTTLF